MLLSPNGAPLDGDTSDTHSAAPTRYEQLCERSSLARLVRDVYFGLKTPPRSVEVRLDSARRLAAVTLCQCGISAQGRVTHMGTGHSCTVICLNRAF